MKVSLTVIKGPGVGAVHEFVEPRGFVIGRAPDCDFQLPPTDPYVSRQHVYLEICPPACRVRDLGVAGAGSTNQPLLNSQPVSEADLTDGDVLELGYTQFQIGIVLDKLSPRVSECSVCGQRIEYLPDEPIPGCCLDCSNNRRKEKGGEATPAKCEQCNRDLTTLANSDGRAAEVDEIARYRCESCLPEADAQISQTIGSYRILGKLGEGGMGTVFLVYDDNTARLWALKQMKDLTEVDLNRRFERGMRLYRDLSHRNIVRCFETGLDTEGHPYVVTEFVGGGEVGESVDAGTALSPDVAVPIVCEILSGLQHLHARKIIHRDIKPPNVLIDRKISDDHGAIVRPLPVPKLADFDMAKCYGLAGGTHITKLNTAMGTLMYMPPEQVRDTATVKEPADLYAVGQMLYYLMTGCYSLNFPTPADIREVQQQRPDEWRSPEEALRLIMKLERIQHPFRIILNEEPVPICQRDRDIPAALAAIVDRAVSKSPGDRFQSAGSFRDTLRAAL